MYGVLRRFIEARDLNNVARVTDDYALDLNGIMPTVGHYPLHFAVEHNSKDCVDFLLAHGVDPNSMSDAKHGGNTSLHIATSKGLYRVAVALVKARANVNAKRGLDGSTPLHLACMVGDSKMKDLLLAARADSSIVDKNGFTARSHALRGGHKDLAMSLKHVPVDIWTGIKAAPEYDRRVAEIRRVLEVKRKKKEAKDAKKKK
jgi:ankyrin repeat protein